MFRTLVAETRLCLLRLEPFYRDGTEVGAEHRGILDALESGRPAQAERLIRLHTAEGWTSRSGRSVVDAIRYELIVLGQRLQALQLLDPDSAPGDLTLTGTGLAAALSALLARALRPRHC